MSITTQSASTGNYVPPRLSYFQAFSLFGQFNNRIKIRTEDRITAIIGPNGRGKTVCLRLIDAFYKRKFSVFLGTEFKYLRFDFDTGSSVIIKKLPDTTKRLPDSEIAGPETLPLEIFFRSAEKQTTRWQPVARASTSIASNITRYIPFVTREGPNMWSDDRSAERYSFGDLIERFGDLLPTALLTDAPNLEPPGFKALTEGVDCHFIETQRLLSIGAGTDSSRTLFESRGRRLPNDPKLVVEQKAQKLKALLQNQLAMFGATSQRLDRSFPNRVLKNSPTRNLTQQQITDQLQKLEDERKALTKAGLIDVELGPMFVPERFDEHLSSVMSIYIDDTEEKLSVFTELRRKIDLFVEILSDRFIGKIVEINQREGFILRSEISKKEIPLDKLSSGEQHQLVLLFELLFELNRDSLILIDEPELSLHVRWQKQFISDLQKIIALNQFDVILATHSPQLISHWRELIVSLGNVYKQ